MLVLTAGSVAGFRALGQGTAGAISEGGAVLEHKEVSLTGDEREAKVRRPSP